MKDKEEFSRKDPDAFRSAYWLAILNWTIPIICVVIGLIITTQKFAILMNHDYRVIGKPLFILKTGYRVYNPLIFILGMFKYAFDDVYSYYFFQAVPAAFIGLVSAVLLFFITSIIVAAHQKNQHIHGTSRWAKRKDLEIFGMLSPRGVVCGELNSARVGYRINREKGNLGLYLPKSFFTRKVRIAPVICHSGSTNTWLIAPTRAGKGVSSIIPTLLSFGVPYYEEITTPENEIKKIIKGKKSVVVFDPKGENWEATAGWRAKFSTCIPFRPLDADGNTAHYNPIHEIPDSPSEAFSWADMIGEIFFGAENAKAASDGATQYFNNTARDIFSGVVMHVRFCKYIAWKDKNLSTVLDIFSQTSDKGENDDEEEGGGCGMAMLNQMRENHIHVNDNGEESPLIHDLIVKAANRSQTQTPRERASTYSTVFSKISLFQDPLLKNTTAFSDFSVDDFIDGKNGISLYLIVPYNHIKRISPVFRMIITFMIKKFSSGTTNAKAVKLKNPCMFLLDEFPVLGYFPDIALNAGILAGYGVTFFIVSQSLNQIIDVYGENHPFLDHCKTIILFAPGNLKDAKQFSETIGNRSVLLDNISSSGSKYEVGFNNISRSSQETQTSLINPDGLMKLDFARLIVFNQGMPPYKGKKVVYYEDPRYKNKSFLEVPEISAVNKQIKKLPSRHKKQIKTTVPSLQKTIEKIQSFEVKQAIPGEFDIFAAS